MAIRRSHPGACLQGPRNRGGGARGRVKCSGHSLTLAELGLLTLSVKFSAINLQPQDFGRLSNPILSKGRLCPLHYYSPPPQILRPSYDRRLLALLVVVVIYQLAMMVHK